MINTINANRTLVSDILPVLFVHMYPLYIQLHGGDIKTETTNEDAVTQFRPHKKYFLMTRRHAL